jgi:hypothetical protein
MTASSGVPELAELILTAAGYEMNGMSRFGNAVAVRSSCHYATLLFHDLRKEEYATSAQPSASRPEGRT